MAEKTTAINPRIVEHNGAPLINTATNLASDGTDFKLDNEWAKHSFLLDDSTLGQSKDINNRYWSSASAKFTDTRMGCNIGINSKPQFTRYADMRVKGRLSGRRNVTIGETSGNFGLGRYYSEAIDDPSQTIYMRFGVPQFNSLTNFLSKAFDGEQTTLANTGRATSFFYDLAKLATTAAAVIAFPAIAIPILAGKVISSFFIRPTSKFYTIKPTMHLYWSTVNVLVNTLAINRGLFPKVDNADGQRVGQPFKLDQDYLTQISNLLPDVFKDNNYFDLYAIANKAQRLANQLFIKDFEALNTGTATDAIGYVIKSMSGDGSHNTYISDSDPSLVSSLVNSTIAFVTDENKGATLAARINKMLSFGYYSNDKKEQRMETDPRIIVEAEGGTVDGKATAQLEQKEPGFFSKFFDHFDAEFRDGSQFAVFKVDHTGSVQESFGNSVIESDLSQKINSVSSQVREARFSFTDGNMVGGVIGDMVGSAIGAVKDVTMATLDTATFGFSSLIAGLGGSGYMDIPKHWQSSSAQLPRSSYTIQLISPYGNIISQVQNILIPLAMLLAGALPRSTGKQSYTSPFICQLFDRGRCQVKLGMIESLSITRGTSNTPFDIKGNALAIDVTFSVVDLSSIMHMPVSSGKLFESDMTLDEDNILSDYLAVLASQDLYTQIYSMPKAKLTLAKRVMALNKLTSPAYWASLFHESSTSGTMQYLTLGAFNVLEAGVRGTSTAVTGPLNN